MGRKHDFSLFFNLSHASNVSIKTSPPDPTDFSLSLSSVALWERKPIVVVPLGIMSIGLWTVGYRTMFIVRAAWSDAAGTCVVVGSDPSLLNVLYFYSKLEVPTGPSH